MKAAIFLVDCENLTATAQRRVALLRLGSGPVELFGREACLTPWRETLAQAAVVVAAEFPVPDDALSQAADDLIHARASVLVARGDTVVVLSNDRGFDAAPACRLGDAGPEELLRLVVARLAGADGWAPGGGVGDWLSRHFGLKPHGRLEAWARAAGLDVTRDGRGLLLKEKTPPGVPGGA